MSRRKHGKKCECIEGLVECAECDGEGAVYDEEEEDDVICPSCLGAGEVACPQCKPKGDEASQEEE